MPNSDANITRLKLIKRAFRRIGISLPNNNDVANAVELLNDKIKEVDVGGRWLWCISNTPSTLTLITNQRSYAAGSGASLIATNILELERVELVNGTSLTPLTIFGKTESIETVLRENTGVPAGVFLEKTPSMASQKMHFFQTPNAAMSIQYYYRRRLYDFDNPTDNPDFPQEWAQKLVKMLSYEMAPEYGIPLQEREILKSERDEALRGGLSSNTESGDTYTETTVYF